MANAMYNQKQYKQAKIRLRGLPCHWCGTPAYTVDHLTPVALGGTNAPENLVAACASCNSKRGAAMPRKRRRRAAQYRARRQW